MFGTTESRLTTPSFSCFFHADLTVNIQVDDNKARLLSNWSMKGFQGTNILLRKHQTSIDESVSIIMEYSYLKLSLEQVFRWPMHHVLLVLAAYCPLFSTLYASQTPWSSTYLQVLPLLFLVCSFISWVISCRSANSVLYKPTLAPPVAVCNSLLSMLIVLIPNLINPIHESLQLSTIESIPAYWSLITLIEV